MNKTTKDCAEMDKLKGFDAITAKTLAELDWKLYKTTHNKKDDEIDADALSAALISYYCVIQDYVYHGEY